MKNNSIIKFWKDLPKDEKQIQLLCSLLIVFIGYLLWFEQGAPIRWGWVPVILWLAFMAGRWYYLKCRKTEKI